jgi:hypothetical protein
MARGYDGLSRADLEKQAMEEGIRKEVVAEMQVGRGGGA